MNEALKGIMRISKIIDDLIQKKEIIDRGMISSSIISQLRNLIEYIGFYEYCIDNNVEEQYDWNAIRTKGKEYIKTCKNLKFLLPFYSQVQISVSHYTPSYDESERLVLKYYEYLIKIKDYFYKKREIKIFNNLKDFPLDIDNDLSNFYNSIIEKINQNEYNVLEEDFNNTYYVIKKKPFFKNCKIYYELTLTLTNNFNNKFDRIIAYTNLNIPTNYSIKIKTYVKSIEVFGKPINVNIINEWKAFILPREINELSKIVEENIKINRNNIEYNLLMESLTKLEYSLYDFIVGDDYEKNKKLILSKMENKISKILNVFDKIRNIIIKNKPGKNILSYLICNIRDNIINDQYSNNNNNRLSDLKLKFGCIPFEEMPYCSSLINHNPSIYKLKDCIDIEGLEYELLARELKNNTEINGTLYTKISNLKYQNIDGLINTYNQKLYKKHLNRKIVKEKDYLYLYEYEKDTIDIINKLITLTNEGIVGYKNSVSNWINNLTNKIDSKEKIRILQELFDKSSVGLIYGAAGTGKSTLISYLSDFFAKNKKLYLSNTNTAVNNLKNKIHVSNTEFMTIKKFINQKNIDNFDIIFIDECSMISNNDMNNFLKKAQYSALLLVGDIYQIESIKFGNWFKLAKNFIKSENIYELKDTFRTNNERLLNVWKATRELNGNITETLQKGGFCSKLDSSLFEKKDDDEMVLCLNYDGLYGINNINRILPLKNDKKSYKIGLLNYKINDPILFNENIRFHPILFNNLKGVIKDIKNENDRYIFTLLVYRDIMSIDIANLPIKLLSSPEIGKSLIQIEILKSNVNDEEMNPEEQVVPFQIAYAISIHKSQGLEYNSVKILITNEMDEMITHNIFYTAITRAKKKLNIYWSPEIQDRVLKSFVKNNSNVDMNIISTKFSLPIYKK